MYKRILIAVDGSEGADRAAHQSILLAQSLGASITVVTVTQAWRDVMVGGEIFAPPPDEYAKEMERSAEALLSSTVQAAAAADVRCTPVHVSNRLAAEGITETAKAAGCDLIVMAARARRGLLRHLTPRLTEKVLARTTTPVLLFQ